MRHHMYTSSFTGDTLSFTCREQDGFRRWGDESTLKTCCLGHAHTQVSRLLWRHNTFHCHFYSFFRVCEKHTDGRPAPRSTHARTTWWRTESHTGICLHSLCNWRQRKKGDASAQNQDELKIKLSPHKNLRTHPNSPGQWKTLVWHKEHCSTKSAKVTKLFGLLSTHILGVRWITVKSVNRSKTCMNRKTVFGNLKKLSISPKDTDLKHEVKMVGKKLSRLMQVYQQTHLDPHLVSYKGFPPLTKTVDRDMESGSACVKHSMW